MWDWYTNGHFYAVLTVLWLFLTVGTLLVDCWYSFCRPVTIGTPMVIFAVLTVFWLYLTVFDDWYTVGTVLVDLWRLVHQWSFLLFRLSLDCFWRLVPYTVGAVLLDMWQLVHQFSFLLLWLSFDCFWQLVHCWYSLGRPVTIGTPMVLSVFDDCTVYHSSKTVKRQSSSKKWPLVYQSSRLHRVHRIHKAAQTPLPRETSITCARAVATARSL